MAKKEMDSKMQYLFEGILSLKTIEDCNRFFEDICTVVEVIEMSNRLAAAKMLADNNTYTDIIEKTGLSTATISRVNRCLKYGSDGYTAVLDRLDAAGAHPFAKEDEE
ncbi:MAG: TrpR-like protein, YerC/YecD [Clostridiales bacterium]|nr:TrpR-like protein, YerC/YecD [Clostridiales bacterium]